MPKADASDTDDAGARLISFESERLCDPELISEAAEEGPLTDDDSGQAESPTPPPASPSSNPTMRGPNRPNRPSRGDGGTSVAAPEDDSPWTGTEGLDGGTVIDDVDRPLRCTFRSTSTFSQVIPTVANVEFTVTTAYVDAATIEYGPTTDYGRTAHVNVDEPGFRTLLLGMAPLTQQHYRIRVEAEGETCTSQDFLFTSGPVPDEFVAPRVETFDERKVATGFVISERAVADGSQVFILDEQGEMVWFYHSQAGGLSRARMSYDGAHMYAQTENSEGEGGLLLRIAMDGSSEEVLDVPEAHHDFAPTADGDLILIRRTGDKCDEITRFSDDGFERIFRVEDAYPAGAELGDGERRCNTTTVLYHEKDDSITFSDVANNAVVKITAAGEVVWVVGGPYSDYTGEGATWERQHGHQLLANDNLLLFNNGPDGMRAGATALEIALNEPSSTARIVWSFESSHSSAWLGDVQRLPNGNTLLTISNDAVIQQVDSDGKLVQELSFSLDGATGYSEFRESLYGPPLR